LSDTNTYKTAYKCPKTKEYRQNNAYKKHLSKGAFLLLNFILKNSKKMNWRDKWRDKIVFFDSQGGLITLFVWIGYPIMPKNDKLKIPLSGVVERCQG
jgi:hypothetical protein